MEKFELKDTRSGFGAGLLELGYDNPNVVALCADLTGSVKMDSFEKEFPDRFFQIGIAEANMMGIAAGLTIGGKIPYTGTFANFSTCSITVFWLPISFKSSSLKDVRIVTIITFGLDLISLAARFALSINFLPPCPCIVKKPKSISSKALIAL